MRPANTGAFVKIVEGAFNSPATQDLGSLPLCRQPLCSSTFLLAALSLAHRAQEAEGQPQAPLSLPIHHIDSSCYWPP